MDTLNKTHEEDAPQDKPQPNIIQHGEGSQVILHQGEGDVNHSNDATFQKLKTENKYLKQMLEEKESCSKVFQKEHREIIKAKDDKIDVLNEEIVLYTNEITRLNHRIEELEKEIDRLSKD